MLVGALHLDSVNGSGQPLQQIDLQRRALVHELGFKGAVQQIVVAQVVQGSGHDVGVHGHGLGVYRAYALAPECSVCAARSEP